MLDGVGHDFPLRWIISIRWDSSFRLVVSSRPAALAVLASLGLAAATAWVARCVVCSGCTHPPLPNQKWRNKKQQLKLKTTCKPYYNIKLETSTLKIILTYFQLLVETVKGCCFYPAWQSSASLNRVCCLLGHRIEATQNTHKYYKDSIAASTTCEMMETSHSKDLETVKKKERHCFWSASSCSCWRESCCCRAASPEDAAPEGVSNANKK